MQDCKSDALRASLKVPADRLSIIKITYDVIARRIEPTILPLGAWSLKTKGYQTESISLQFSIFNSELFPVPIRITIKARLGSSHRVIVASITCDCRDEYR